MNRTLPIVTSSLVASLRAVLDKLIRRLNRVSRLGRSFIVLDLSVDRRHVPPLWALVKSRHIQRENDADAWVMIELS